MITVDTKEFISVLNKIYTGLVKAKDDEAYFVFDKDRIKAQTETFSIYYPFQTEISCCIKAREFYEVLSKIKTKELTLSFESNQLLVSAGKTKAGFNTKETNFGSDMKEETWREVPSDFLEALKMTEFSVSKDESLGWLNCFLIQENTVFSSDDYRISRYEMGGSFNSQFLLPLATKKLLDEFQPKEFFVSSGQVSFKNSDGAIISLLTLEDSSAGDFSDFFSEEGGREFDLTKFPVDSLQKIEMLHRKEMEANRVMTVNVQPDKITIYAEQEGIGWLEETIEGEFAETLSFMINPSLLKQIITSNLTMLVKETTCLFYSDKFYHEMVLPVGE